MGLPKPDCYCAAMVAALLLPCTAGAQSTSGSLADSPTFGIAREPVAPIAIADVGDTKPEAHAEPPPSPYGAVFRSITGGALTDQKITVLGWAEATAAISDNTGNSLSPGGFLTDSEGLTFNQLGLMLCGGAGCIPQAFGPAKVAARVGPFPGPAVERVTVGFNVTAVVGEDAGLFRITGFDGDIGFDRDRDVQIAFTQAFVDVSLPIGEGTSVLIGSFHTSLANEIGYSFDPPNGFVTKTYAFQHGPAKHVGVLAQTLLPTSPSFGLLSVEYGLVRGWNNFDDPNGNLDVIGGVRYRSPDMRTWVDVEAIYGDGNNEFGPGPSRGGAPFFALSSTGEYLSRFAGYLVVTHKVDDLTDVAFEATYGSQEGGDLAPSPIFITRDAEWYGANVSAKRKLSPRLTLGARAEVFRDAQGAHVLWAGSPGTATALTGSAQWQLTPALRLRGEVRHDWFDGRPGARPLFDEGRSNRQLAAYLNLFAAF